MTVSASLRKEKSAMIKLFRVNNFIMVILVVGCNLIVSLAFSVFAQFVFNRSVVENSIQFDSVREEFLIAVIGAPLLETFVYQYILISIVFFLSKKLFKKEGKALAIVLPAVFFSLGHTYNIFYIIGTFIGGMSLNFLYVFTRIKSKYPFLYVALAHALYNLAALGLRRIG